MDNWDATVVYQIVSIEHQERVARGESIQRQRAILGGPPARARLAAALVALAARLDPALNAARRTGTPLTPSAAAS